MSKDSTCACGKCKTTNRDESYQSFTPYMVFNNVRKKLRTVYNSFDGKTCKLVSYKSNLKHDFWLPVDYTVYCSCSSVGSVICLHITNIITTTANKSY